jgi:transposase
MTTVLQRKNPGSKATSIILNWKRTAQNGGRNSCIITGYRDQRYQILPAYAQDGIVLSRVFKGSTDASVFEDFIEQLLQHCGKWPEPKSVLVMDNASFHHSDRIKQMCSETGVKLVYLPPYSPDLNPIEEYFAEPKAFIRRNWQSYEENLAQGLWQCSIQSGGGGPFGFIPR